MRNNRCTIRLVPFNATNRREVGTGEKTWQSRHQRSGLPGVILEAEASPRLPTCKYLAAWYDGLLTYLFPSTFLSVRSIRTLGVRTGPLIVFAEALRKVDISPRRLGAELCALDGGRRERLDCSLWQANGGAERCDGP